MSASIGGGYGALLSKKTKKGGGKNENPGSAPKVKAAKVISLKDTTQKPQPNAKKEEEKKKDEQPPAVEKPVERDLTKREYNKERSATDRQYRGGNSDHTKEKKNEQVTEALEAANEKGSDAIADKDQQAKKEAEERDAERKRKAEEDARQMTYADYQKKIEQDRKELASLSKSHERKIDAKSFSKMKEMDKKDDDDDTLTFYKKEAPKAPKATGKAAKNAKAAAKPAAKEGGAKKKFVKTSDIQVGFYCKPAQPPRERREFTPKVQQDQTEAPEAAPAAETAAPPADATPDGEW